jgi:hypothetical protein
MAEFQVWIDEAEFQQTVDWFMDEVFYRHAVKGFLEQAKDKTVEQINQGIAEGKNPDYYDKDVQVKMFTQNLALIVGEEINKNG